MNLNASSNVGLLYCGIKNMLRCDDAEVVRGIAHYVISQHRGLRLLSVLIERTRNSPLPGVIAVIGWLRSFLSVRSGKCRDGAVWIARLGNERRAIEAMLSFAPELPWTELKFGLLPDAGALRALRRNFAPRRVFKLVRRLHRQHEFFKVLRVVEFIGYWTRYQEIFRQGRFSLAVMSSHSNPHGIAFNLAARQRKIPVVLISHGMPIRPVARLSYDLAVVHCEAARQTYLAEGCRITRVLVHGRRQDLAQMPSDHLPERLIVGVFLCKDVNEEGLRALIARLLSYPEVSGILIRPHPKNLSVGLNKWVASLNNQRVVLASSHSVRGDVEAADVVLAGNSSVLIDAVIAGRPSGYLTDLDHAPRDLHSFVERGLIYPVRIARGNSRWNPDVILRFYQRPGWPDVLRLFANIDQDETSVAARAGAIMRELAEAGSLATD